MIKKLVILAIIFAVFTGIVYAQDLKIDYQVNVSASDSSNYFTFLGPIRYLSADKDQLDSKTGASVKGSTKLFQGYKADVKGKSVIPDGLRGLFLFAVGDYKSQQGDALTVSKAGDGVITIQYVHRGTAYMIVTDKSGKINVTKSTFKKRAVGYIKGTDPQVIHKDFSNSGKAENIDFKKVWDSKIAGDKEIAADVKVKTGNIADDAVSPEAMYFWDGDLQAAFDGKILKIAGGLTAVKK